MRRAAIVGGIGVALVILLVATNPSKSEYVDWLKGQVRAQASGNVVSLGLTALLGSAVFDAATTRQDFLLFSVFRTSVAGNNMTVLGVLHHFIPIQDASASTKRLAGTTSTSSGSAQSLQATDPVDVTTREVPVKALRSTYVLAQFDPSVHMPKPDYPASVRAVVPARWAKQVTAYGIFNTLILGPTGWRETQDSVEAVDGSIRVTLVPDQTTTPAVPAGQIMLVTSGGCKGCAWAEAAAYIPWVRDHWHDSINAFSDEQPNAPPQGMVVRSAQKDRVFYTLTDGDLAQKGLFVTGVAYFDLSDNPDGQGNDFVRLEVALPPEDKDLALSIVQDYADRELNKMSRQ